MNIESTAQSAPTTHREPISRSLIRGVFLRNGFRIEDGRDDLPDCVYEAAFDLLEAVGAPAVQGEPVAYSVFASNGNIRIWCADPVQVETLRQQYGDQLTPLYEHPAAERPPSPSDEEMLSWAGEEQFFLFCDRDEFLQIARAVLERFGMADAYSGAAEDKEIWKKRALEAEAALRQEKETSARLCNALNHESGPANMGEPVLPKEGQSWSGWACQAPGRMPRLYGSREIAELNFCPESGDRLFFLSEPTEQQPDVTQLVEALELALEYWKHRQQRYKNRSPMWVTKAREALAAYRKGGDV